MRIHSFLIILFCLLQIACSGQNTAIKSSGWDPSKYSVQHGDTLYSIAWRYDLDFKQLAKWNRITRPYLIRPGQRLIMKPPAIQPINKVYLFGGVKPKNTQPELQSDKSIDFSISKNIPTPPPVDGYKRAVPTYNKTVPKYNRTAPKRTTSYKPPSIVKNNKLVTTGPVEWSWPIKGKVISKFAANKNNRKGIDIKGRQNQKILAAGKGVVVYSGAGLQSYGKLVIIKHSDRFLSAYAFNKKLLVKEGTRVNKGQSIAIIGKKQTVTNLLHFEIRKDGKPVNPLVYLP